MNLCGAGDATSNQWIEDLLGTVVSYRWCGQDLSCPERINTALYGFGQDIKQGVTTRLSTIGGFKSPSPHFFKGCTETVGFGIDVIKGLK